jgi:hypothetical protein
MEAMTNRHQEHRRGSRLHVDGGIVLLEHLDQPAVGCSLTDLSEEGCQCHFPLKMVDKLTAENWQALLHPGMVLRVALSRPPQLPRLAGQASVRRVVRDPDGSGFSLGLEFTGNGAAFNATLKAGVLGVAAEKIRQAPHAAGTDAEKPRAPVPPSEAAKSKQAGKQVRRTLAQFLAANANVTLEELAALEQESHRKRIAFNRYLLQKHVVTPESLCRALAVESGLPVVDLSRLETPKELCQAFKYLFMLRHEFIPFNESKEMLCVAAGAPLPADAVTEIQKVAGREVLLFLAPLDQIRGILFRIRPRGPFQSRQHLRVPSAVPVSFEYCDDHGVSYEDNTVYEGFTINVSPSGLLIEAPKAKQNSFELIERGACVRIEFECNGGQLHAICRIRHIEDNKSSPHHLPWSIGLEIVSMEEECRKRLADTCTNAGLNQMQQRVGGYDTHDPHVKQFKRT